MESWNNGCDQLFEQLTKVCDQIGSNIRAELNDESMVRINREELRLLRINSASMVTEAENNARLQVELEKARAAATRVDVLEQENKRLAAELLQRLESRQESVANPKVGLAPKQAPKSSLVPSDPPPSVTRINCDETKSVPVEDYQRLVRKYNALHENWTATKDARQVWEDKFRAAVETKKEWDGFVEKQTKSDAKKDAKIKRLEAEVQRLSEHLKGETVGTPAKHNSDPSNNQSFNESGEVEVPKSSPIRNSDQVAILRRDTRYEEEVREEDGAVVDREREDIDLPRHRNFAQVEETQFVGLEAHHTSSTEGDSDPLSLQKVVADDTPDLLARRSSSPETPIVIEARSVRKRKARHEISEATPVAKVKVELISSSPIGLARMLSVNESLDLDDIGEKVDTPRKHCRLQQELARQASQNPLQSLGHAKVSVSSRAQEPTIFSDDNSTVVSKSTLVRRTDSVLQPRNTNENMLPRTSEATAPKKRRIASNKDIDTLMEDGELVTLSRKKRESNGGSTLLNLLNKPSPPKTALGSLHSHATNQQGTPPHRPTPTSGLALEIARLPPQRFWNNAPRNGASTKVQHKDPRDSDGRSVASSRPSSRDTPRTSVEPSRPVSRQSKKDSLSPQKSPAGSVKRPTEDISSHPPSTMDALLPRRDLQAAFTPKLRLANAPGNNTFRTPKNGMSSGKLPQSLLNKSAQIDHTIEPEEEPLRARPLNRLCLSDFKVNTKYHKGSDFAYRDVVRGNARHSLDGCTKPECCGGQFRALALLDTAESPTASQEERDDELLRKYMGDNAHKLRSMSKEDRFELLVQAKTRDLSNKHGRHRHAYTRPVTPPGFWRNDFPTTQEEREDQAKAKEHERALVVDRYNEAMRPGGRFIFRDE